MPAGLSKIRQLADEAEARSASFESGSGVRFFSLANGESATVRFLEQGEGVAFYWTHQLPKQPGQQFGDRVLCLDQDDKGQPCPGCARGKNRSPRVAINVIWHGAPRFEREAPKDGQALGKVKKDANNKPVVNGVENCVATWELSQGTGGRLDTLHTGAVAACALLGMPDGGLMFGIYKITRRGTGRNTTYDIDLRSDVGQGGYLLPTAEEIQLFATKPDPKAVMRELSYGDMERRYSAATGGPVQAAPSGFAAAATDVTQRGGLGGGAVPSLVTADNPPPAAPVQSVNLGAFGS